MPKHKMRPTTFLRVLRRGVTLNDSAVLIIENSTTHFLGVAFYVCLERGLAAAAPGSDIPHVPDGAIDCSSPDSENPIGSHTATGRSKIIELTVVERRDVAEILELIAEQRS